MKFLGAPLEIPAGVGLTQAVRKSYVDAAAESLGDRVDVLEAIGAGGGLAVRPRSSTYSALAGEFILADASTAGFTVTLPDDPPVNSLVAVKKVDSTTELVTVVGFGGASVDGAASLELGVPQAGAQLVYDGTAWWALALAGGGTVGVVVSPTPPTVPQVNVIWIDTSGGS